MRLPRKGVERSSGPQPSSQALPIQKSGIEQQPSEQICNLFTRINDSTAGSVSQTYLTWEPFVT